MKCLIKNRNLTKSKRTFSVSDPTFPLNAAEKKRIVLFLHEHLEEYGDSERAILNCLDYALKEVPSFGGYIVELLDGKEVIGVAVINHTGMLGYIPEHILVYIAIHKQKRGLGNGARLLQKVIDLTQGDLALHVEPDNPAAKLYSKFGFTSKYLEMRRVRESQ